MNPLVIESLARDRSAQLQRAAHDPHARALAATSGEPAPLPPRRRPLAVIASLARSVAGGSAQAKPARGTR